MRCGLEKDSATDCNNGAQRVEVTSDGDVQADAPAQSEVGGEEQNSENRTGAKEAAVIQNDGGVSSSATA